MATYRFYNAAGDRISTAVTLRDGGLLQVFPTKDRMKSMDSWKQLHPTWTELRNDNHTIYNDVEAPLNHDDMLDDLNNKLRIAKTRGQRGAACFDLWSYVLKHCDAMLVAHSERYYLWKHTVARMECDTSIMNHKGMPALLKSLREKFAEYNATMTITLRK
jgi:hypothetical protein